MKHSAEKVARELAQDENFHKAQRMTRERLQNLAEEIARNAAQDIHTDVPITVHVILNSKNETLASGWFDPDICAVAYRKVDPVGR